MKVDPDKARTAGLFAAVQGKTYYFCSEECKEEFHLHGPQPDASAGAGPGPETSSGHEMQATDTMHAVPADTSTTHEPQTAPQAIPAEPGKATVKDPVCGMTVDPDTARTAGLFAEAQGKTYYFCSEECKEKFHQNGPQADASAGADPGPEASSGHGRQVAKTKHAEPADTSTRQEPQHSPEKQTPADAPGDGEHDHD